jgi:aquaporin Z
MSGKAKQVLDKLTNKEARHKYFAEFVGTYMLVFTVALVETVDKSDIFGPTSIACMLMVMVYALGSISGGHFNPAVTFACVVQNYIDPLEGVAYIVVQLGAAVVGALCCLGIFDATTDLKPNTDDYNPMVYVGALLIEFFYTFMLCFVVLNVAYCAKKEPSKNPNNNYYGLAIGFVIIAGGYAGGNISGGAFNPAVALGLTVANFQVASLYLPFYMAVEMAGGFMAAFAFNIVRPEEKEKLVGASGHFNFIEKFINKVADKLDPEDTCEILGTFMLSFTWALNGIVTEKMGNPAGVWSIAACLMCMIYAVGDVSGGLFNPAVSLAALARYYGTGQGIGEKNASGKYGRLADPKQEKLEGLKYCLYQIIGGAAGVALTFFVLWQWPPGAAVGPQAPWDLLHACFAEFFGTFVLAYVILAVALSNHPLEEYKAFAIGGCIIACGYGFAPVSGGVLNPSLAIANYILRFDFVSNVDAPCYLLAEIMGSLTAALIFRKVTHKKEFEEVPASSAPLLATNSGFQY